MDKSRDGAEQEPLPESLRSPELSAGTLVLLRFVGAVILVVLGAIAGTESDVLRDLLTLLLSA